jgi:serine/threonine-protein kinase
MTREERYEILETIQDGMYATSYKARDKVLDRMVLLKVLHMRQACDADLVQRFRREATLQARLKHPGIVTVYDFGAENDFYIASEFIEGMTLEQRLKERGRLSLDELRPVIRQVVRALSYAHEQGVVHRDLKPANIMIAANGEAKLADFGLAYARDYSPLTMEGCVVGTPAYMSPEQSRGRKTDARTDIFSLGVVIYEALSGTNPFQSDSYADSLNLILNRDPTPLAKTMPDLPAGVSRLVEQMLVKDPEQRLSSLDEVSRILESEPQGTGDRGSGVQGFGGRGAARRRWQAAALPIAVGALAVLTLVLLPVFRRATGRSSAPDIKTASQQPESGLRESGIQGIKSPLESSNLRVPESSNAVTATTPATAAPVAADLTVRPDSTRSPQSAVRSPQFPESSAVSPEPRFTRLKVTVTPWAEVLVDGRSFGVTPLGERLELTQGTHELMLKNPNYPILTRKLVLDDTAAIVNYDLEHEFAQADIRVQPWALVTIDGQFVDTTPMKRPVALTLGPHTITLNHPELGTRVENVHTDSARLYRFDFNMTQR